MGFVRQDILLFLQINFLRKANALCFFALWLWAVPATACVDKSLDWGFNPQSIARGTLLIEKGDFFSDASRGDCAIHVYRLLRVKAEIEVCDDPGRCVDLYRRFLDKLIGYLVAAKYSASTKEQRSFYDSNLREARIDRSKISR